MKKFIKLITLPTLALFLVACQNTTEEQPVESVPVESVEEASTEENSQVSLPESSESADESGESNADGDTSTEESESDTSEENENKDDSEEASETAVTFAFFVSGEEEPIAKFSSEEIEGLSVLEAMEANEDLTFNFNEDEGVIDSIEGYENDYSVGNTWTYVLNGEYAQLGVVSQTLTAGDQIDWYFGTIDEIPINVIQAE
ncbi:DUF4430 domain-containing protein [Aerococcaceae bacterium WGS1372]